MNVVIIDDDKLVCQALKTILESDKNIDISDIGYNGLDAIKLFDLHKPEILLMDIRMGEMTGIEAGREILQKHKEANILYLTTFADNEYIIEALKIGAKGYLLKQDFESIIPALKAVASGQSVFGNEIISKIPSLLGSKSKKTPTDWGLTEKELTILHSVSEGLSNKEIAEQNFLSEGTVRNYISNILDKLHLRDRTQLAIFYYKNKEGL